MPPIYATSTYVQSSPGVHKGYDYSRTRNPTRDALQAAVANLEGGAAGFAFASGMAATSTVLELLDSGSHIIACMISTAAATACSRTFRKRSAGHEVSFVDLTNPASWRPRSVPNTRLVWVETPTNPLLKLVDLSAVAAIARKARTAERLRQHVLPRPSSSDRSSMAFDIVVHSTTKYLNGHSDALGGAAVVRADDGLRNGSDISRTR